jgi:DNA (cytosine-5)-methyltransferase 1
MGAIILSISYNKLWHLLVDKKMSKTELRRAAGVSTNVIAKLGKNESVSMDSLGKICEALDCDLSDIVEMTNGRKEVRT